ncbi:MAG: single-stranded DNA-binding protein [Patescibacteria group bacterium]
MNLNRATLMGNLTHDPEVKTAAGKKVASFSIATNAVWRDAKSKALKESVEFHPVVAWGHLADVVEKYVRKGDRLYVEGRLANRKWEDRLKQKHERTEVVVNQLIMLGSARKGAKPEAVSASA